MDPLFQASHSSHTTTSIKSQHSEGTGVQKETSVKLKENLPVSDDILQDLSLLINDEWLAVGKFLKIPEKNLPKIHTDYGARQKEATYSMLLSWKKEMGKNATYDILVDALKKAGRGDLADLSTELTDSQEQLFVMKELLKRQQRLYDLTKHRMAEKTSPPSSESYSMQQDLLLAIEENIRCQERLINLHKRELEMEEEIFLSWHIYGFRKRTLKMANKPFLTSPELHDLQESLILSIEFLNCQERLIELRKLNMEMEEDPFILSWLDRLQLRLSNMKAELHRLKGLLEPEIDEFKKRNQPSLLSKSPELEILEFKKENQPSLPSKSPDKLDHFIRCLKAKYITWVKSLKNTPWMKYNKLNIEDLFVDVDLLWHPSQSTMSPSSWQPLFSFQDLFTHSKLRRAHYITVEGESGSGKTILLYRMAHSWCINESFTQDIKLFILLPWSCICEHCSLYMSIKRLLPKNTFLTVEDVRNILTNTKSIVALDDSPPHVVNRILDTDPLELLMPLHKDMGDLLAAENLQLMCFTSVNTNSLHTQKISNMTVKLQKWHKKQQLSYLQKLLPKDDKTHELILKRLGENSTLVNACGNPLFYVLFVHLLKDDVVYGKDVTIKNLWQLLKSTFKNLNKNAITKPVQKEEESEEMSYLYGSTFPYLTKYTIPKPMEDEKETERMSYPQSISEAAYVCFRKNEWQIDYRGDERDYQTLEDLGILVKDQKNCFNRLSTPYLTFQFGMTHKRLVRFRFCHKIFHLWFAVLYLSECSNIREEYERLFSPKFSLHWLTPQPITDKALLQRFICGLNSECSVILLEDLARGRYAHNNDDDEHFFVCLNEYCGNDDSLRAVVNAICQRKREFTLGCSNQLVLKSMTRLLNLASQWKIAIDCINLTNHDIGDVDEEGLTLNNSVRLRPLSAKLIRINKWCGKQLSNYLNKCVHLVETRIFANDPRERRHEIQREVKEMNFKVRWESNYTYESNVRETKEDEIINLAVLFENLDVDSDDATASKRSGNIQETLHRNDFEDSTNNLPESFKFSFEQIQDSPPAVLNAILSTEMYVDARGGTLVIEEAGISLEIPPDALNEVMTISIAVVNDAGVILPHDDTPMVSQIVQCKPSGQTFQKPVTLVLPHCGILNDNKDHKVISMKSYISGGRRQWSIFTDTETVLSKRECSLKLTNFCFHCCSISGLESKIMRAFILKKRTDGALSVKLWICNDNPSVFANILNMEKDDGYQQMGAHQEFAIYKTLGDIESKCIGDEMKIPLADIWRGRGRFAVFYISFDSGNIGETLVAKQLGQEDDRSLRFFIDEKAHCKRRKLKQNSTDSTIAEQPSALIPVSKNSLDFSKTVSTVEERNEVKDVNGNDLVSESSLRKLSGLLTAEWKDLGIELGLTEANIQHIKNDQQGKEKEIIYQMLLYWKKAKGGEATYGHIFDKLRKVCRRDLVESPQLKEKWVTT